MFSILAEKLPSIKIIHGKPRHPESQGAVERANRDIKDALFTMMLDNRNDQCWVKYLKWVKFHKNTSYHSTIKMTPFEAVYNKKPSFGLSHLGIAHEFWGSIDTEEDLAVFQREVSGPAAAEVRSSELSFDEVDELLSQSSYPVSHHSPVPYNSKFRPQIDEYESQIHYPLPVGTLVTEGFESPIESNYHPFQTGYHQPELTEESELTSNQTQTHHHSPGLPFSQSPTPLRHTEIIPDNNMDCVACGQKTSGVHSCPDCFRFIHTVCGRLVGEEGYGSSVVCPACDLASRKETCSTMRAGIKRSQESLHHRMLNSSSNKFKPAYIGNTVIIPISEPDKVKSLGPRNIIGCITGKDDSTYTVGTSQGTISVAYTRNQFELCHSNLLSIESVPPETVTQTEVTQSASLGITNGSSCRCKFCKTQRCPCEKSGRACNSKCHKDHSCFNK